MSVQTEEEIQSFDSPGVDSSSSAFSSSSEAAKTESSASLISFEETVAENRSRSDEYECRKRKNFEFWQSQNEAETKSSPLSFKRVCYSLQL